jgi:hypothetical protein
LSSPPAGTDGRTSHSLSRHHSRTARTARADAPRGGCRSSAITARWASATASGEQVAESFGEIPGNARGNSADLSRFSNSCYRILGKQKHRVAVERGGTPWRRRYGGPRRARGWPSARGRVLPFRVGRAQRPTSQRCAEARQAGQEVPVLSHPLPSLVPVLVGKPGSAVHGQGDQVPACTAGRAHAEQARQRCSACAERACAGPATVGHGWPGR